MADANAHSKPRLEMMKRQQLIMQNVQAAMALLSQTIAEAEAEGILLAQKATEFEQAELRGESPDPQEVSQVVAAQDALLQRFEMMNGHIVTMGQQADAVIAAADAISFDALLSQFKRQFNIKEDL